MASYDIAPQKTRGHNNIKLYDRAAFDALHKAGRLASAALDLMVDHIQPGVTTEQLDYLIFEFAMDHGAIPATLYYRGYTKSSCISLNHVVCHGIPGSKTLKEGDILNIDVTLIVDGWHGDNSRMYAVGDVKRKAERLIDVTYHSMMKGIEAVKAGATTGDIGHAIQTYAEAERCSVVRDFCGHGIGQKFHEPPNILHYGNPGEGIELLEGMVFTIEPMINLGKSGVKILSDGWTAVTRDKSLSAQFEHMIGVTKEGCEIFTLSPKGLHCPPYKAE